MLNLKQFAGAAVIAASAFGFVSGASAAPTALSNGQTLFNGSSPVGLFEQGGFSSGSSILATNTIHYVAATFQGDLTSWVISGDTNNYLGGNVFVYQFSNELGGSAAGIHRLTVSGFGSFNTAAGFNNAAIGGDLPGGAPGAVNTAPTSVDLSAGVVGWNFLPSPQSSPAGSFNTPGALLPGPGAGPLANWSSLLVVYTDSQTYGFTTASLINGSSVNTTTLAPVAAVPEPETYAMMLAGLGLMGFVARRRKNNNNA